MQGGVDLAQAAVGKDKQRFVACRRAFDGEDRLADVQREGSTLPKLMPKLMWKEKKEKKKR